METRSTKTGFMLREKISINLPLIQIKAFTLGFEGEEKRQENFYMPICHDELNRVK